VAGLQAMPLPFLANGTNDTFLIDYRMKVAYFWVLLKG
jgi:hypothetical protein